MTTHGSSEQLFIKYIYQSLSRGTRGCRLSLMKKNRWPSGRTFCLVLKSVQRFVLLSSGAQDLQELAEMTDRACGGGHTLTYPHSRAIFRGLQFNKEEFEFLAPVQKELQAVDILGQDGHIYKGLVENLPCLPHLPQKPKSAGSRADSRHSRRSLRRSGTPTPSPAPPQEQTVDDQDNSSWVFFSSFTCFTLWVLFWSWIKTNLCGKIQLKKMEVIVIFRLLLTSLTLLLAS